jgi:hypothetical protein
VIAPTIFHDHGRAVAAASVAGLYAAAAALTEPLTGVATIAWLIPALIVLIVGGRLAPPTAERSAPARPLRRTAVAWSALVAIIVALEVTAWLQQPAYNVGSPEHPTISLLLDPILEPWPVRFAAWAAWLWVGWRLVRR